jgi:hypothetical protein
MQRLLALALALLALALVVVLVWTPNGPHRPRFVASWTETPGVLNPEVTQATIRRTICVPGWTRTIRPPSSYTSLLKEEQIREFGLAGTPADYQEDHLISLELGGHPTDPRNLWPEPHPRAEQVDRIENELNRQVCSGALSLAEAQRRESAIKHHEG